MSEQHLQWVFSQWAGISAERYLQLMTKQAAVDALQKTSDLLCATHAIGLSGSGRAHDRLVTCETMTAEELKGGGHGVSIEYGVCLTPFGDAILGWTPRGVCFLQFVQKNQQSVIDALYRQWPNTRCRLNNEQAVAMGHKIFASPLKPGKIHLLLKGTNFQVKVWEALIKTSPSQRLSYSQMAQLIDAPKASRAVGTALANNTIGYLIPCHRVIKSNGDIGNYRWGVERKMAMLAWEKSQFD